MGLELLIPVDNTWSKKTKPVTKSNSITGETLLNMNIREFPTLLKPIFPKVGLIAIAGSSDTGKSTFLRQFAINISCGKNDFLGFSINATHRSAVVMSTEDDELAISYLMNKQNSIMDFPVESFRDLRYIFETSTPVESLDIELTKQPADVVIVDAFSDLYGGEMNATNKVRSFLNEFGNLAKKHECLIIFLHHTGKGKDKLEPSKHNLLGSQGFEAKMRLVIELRRDLHNPSLRHLCIVKGNYLPEEYKNESYVLSFDENMIFRNEQDRVPFTELAEISNGNNEQTENRKKQAIELKEKGFNQTQIAEKLGVNKSTINRYFKNDTD